MGVGVVAEEKEWWSMSSLPVSVPLVTDETTRTSWAPLTKCEQETDGMREKEVLCSAWSIVHHPLNTTQCSSAPLTHLMVFYKGFSYWKAYLLSC